MASMPSEWTRSCIGRPDAWRVLCAFRLEGGAGRPRCRPPRWRGPRRGGSGSARRRIRPSRCIASLKAISIRRMSPRRSAAASWPRSAPRWRVGDDARPAITASIRRMLDALARCLPGAPSAAGVDDTLHPGRCRRAGAIVRRSGVGRGISGRGTAGGRTDVSQLTDRSSQLDAMVGRSVQNLWRCASSRVMRRQEVTT